MDLLINALSWVVSIVRRLWAAVMPGDSERETADELARRLRDAETARRDEMLRAAAALAQAHRRAQDRVDAATASSTLGSTVSRWNRDGEDGHQ